MCVCVCVCVCARAWGREGERERERERQTERQRQWERQREKQRQTDRHTEREERQTERDRDRVCAHVWHCVCVIAYVCVCVCARECVCLHVYERRVTGAEPYLSSSLLPPSHKHQQTTAVHQHVYYFKNPRLYAWNKTSSEVTGLQTKQTQKKSHWLLFAQLI